MGDPEVLEWGVGTFNLTSGTRGLPLVTFFKVETSCFLTIGTTVVGRECAIERTEEEE